MVEVDVALPHLVPAGMEEADVLPKPAYLHQEMVVPAKLHIQAQGQDLAEAVALRLQPDRHVALEILTNIPEIAEQVEIIVDIRPAARVAQEAHRDTHALAAQQDLQSLVEQVEATVLHEAINIRQVVHIDLHVAVLHEAIDIHQAVHKDPHAVVLQEVLLPVHHIADRQVLPVALHVQEVIQADVAHHIAAILPVEVAHQDVVVQAEAVHRDVVVEDRLISTVNDKCLLGFLFLRERMYHHNAIKTNKTSIISA